MCSDKHGNGNTLGITVDISDIRHEQWQMINKD